VDAPRTAPQIAFFHSSSVQKSLERLLYIWGIRWRLGHAPAGPAL